MAQEHSTDYLTELVSSLCRERTEREWLEFKRNNENPELIGRSISAISNGAALSTRSRGYILWGIDDQTHEVVGTTFDPDEVKKGNEPLRIWLRKALSEHIGFQFHQVVLDGNLVTILEIAPALQVPTSFQHSEYIRVGEVTKKLTDVPALAHSLWSILVRSVFEEQIVAERVPIDDVFATLDWESYLRLTGAPECLDRDTILGRLEAAKLVAQCDAGGWNVTNLGAILFARKLSEFESLKNRTVRVVRYDGLGRGADIIEQRQGNIGYAAGFEGLLAYINRQLTKEVVGDALREQQRMLPTPAVRELVANALIHQDFLIEGASPIVHIFEDRIEIANPGRPLLDPNRFVGGEPDTRNPELSELMRRCGVCERLGRGVGKAVEALEAWHLPAPRYDTSDRFTRVVLHGPRDISDMTRDQRIWACYLHACLQLVNSKSMTNSSLRQRFGLDESKRSLVSRVISDTIEGGWILVRDSESGSKRRDYVPYWASGGSVW